LNWNWDPATWKKPPKLVLGLLTIWPILYIPLFLILIFSGMFLGILFGEPSQPSSRLDLIQLERKIQNGEIKELKAFSREIRATDRYGRHFETTVDNQTTREEIIRQARELDSNQRPRVEKIEENASEPQGNPIFPAGFMLVFVLHMFTILLSFLLMPLYIILAVKNERLDQTMRIVWVVLACTVGMFSNIVYWYQHIWRRPAGNGTGATPPTQATAAT
jgi:hypothetical protein